MAIWADAVFVWNPGDAVTASSDEISATSASGLTEGTFTSTPRSGRVYTGAQGSRFGVTPITDWTNGVTWVTAIRDTTGTATGAGIFIGNSAAPAEYALTYRDTGGVISAQIRDGGASPDDNTWPYAQWTAITDTAVHVVAGRSTVSGTDVVVELWVDGAPYSARRVPNALTFTENRVTVGRIDDSTPFNSAGIGVYSAAAWDRALTDAEMRAVMSDPYSYPVDPADPGWETGVDEWQGCVFYWDPNGAETHTLDRAHGGAQSNGSLTEGTAVTVSTREGRQYPAGRGSRFDIEPTLGVTGQQAAWSMMAVVRQPAVTDSGFPLWLGRRTGGAANNSYFLLQRTTTAVLGDRRTNGATMNAAGWAIASYALAADTDMHVLVWRSTGTTVEVFVDAFADTDTDTQAFLNDQALNRTTVGRIDDAGPSDSADLQVFAAAMWSRALTDDEVAAVLADPYGFPGGAPPPPTPSGNRMGGTGAIRKSPHYGGR